MKYYKMLMDGHLAAIVSEDEIGANKAELEADGWVFEETKCVAPPSAPMIEWTCGECGYIEWIVDDGADEIDAECSVCGAQFEFTRAHQGAWYVKQAEVPEDQVVLTDEEVE